MAADNTQDLRQYINTAISQLSRLLVKQAPLLNVTPANPLPCLQHLSFEAALAELKNLSNSNGYLPESLFVTAYQQGRITDSDIDVAFSSCKRLEAQEILLETPDKIITRGDILRIALLYGIDAISPNQFAWQLEELNALAALQPDLPTPLRQQLPQPPDEAAFVSALWEALLQQLELEPEFLHPENRLDLSLEQAEALLAQHRAARQKVSLKKSSMHEQMCEAAGKLFAEELARLGENRSLRSLLLALSGIDILNHVRPEIIRICSSALDENIAPWQLPKREELGLYGAWRAVLGSDVNPFLQELSDWQALVAQLPDIAEDTIILHLTDFGLPVAQWPGYLHCLAQELPGWSGMIHWREQHPTYQSTHDSRPRLADYLAIRLTLDRLWLNQICHDIWQIDATLSSLQTYFRKNPSEFMVRLHLFRGELPEYLVEQAEAMTLSVGIERFNRTDWHYLADIIWTWQINKLSQPTKQPNYRLHTVYDSAWRLFRLAQHLGLSSNHLANISKQELEQMLMLLDSFTLAQRHEVWLAAYEHHYRQLMLQALHCNYLRQQNTPAPTQPTANLVFSMVASNEGIRRHLETINPSLVTLACTSFADYHYQPQTVTQTSESATATQNIPPQALQTTGQKLLQLLKHLQYHTLRHNFILAPLLITLTAPYSILQLLGKVFFPYHQQRLSKQLRDLIIPKPNNDANAVNLTHSLSDNEQAAHLARFFQHIGVTSLSQLLVLIAHRSSSHNNPQFVAYADKESPASVRNLAASINRPAVRTHLAKHGITIPTDFHCIAAAYDSANDAIRWLDTESLPTVCQANLAKIQQDFDLARQQTAQERCRQLHTASTPPSLNRAIAHVRARAADFAQLRPENAHAGTAALCIGRRHMSQSLFLDRRVMLCSYDAAQDQDGLILREILTKALPIAAGISLTYYFAKANPQSFSSGNQVLHNVIAGISVMEGSSGDLRTSPSQQMLEAHEAMRLQLVLEADKQIVEQMMQQHSPISELIRNRWVQLNTLDPLTGNISCYSPETGFNDWQPNSSNLAYYSDSLSYYRSSAQALAPVFICPPENQAMELS